MKPIVAVGLVLCGWLLGIGLWYAFIRSEPTPIVVQPGATLDCIGVTTNGDKVYRLSGQYTVVPSIIVITRTGAVAIR